MNREGVMRLLLATAIFAAVAVVGCKAPGAPGPAEERPEEVRDFHALYKQNCAACHGEQGRGGIATSMANSVYIAFAGQQQIAKAIREGGPGELMPAFGKKHGGFLTDEQVNILAYGIVQRWGQAHAAAGVPAYTASLVGNADAGKQVFTSTCARCHQQGVRPDAKKHTAGSITDPDFLALISDQNLRSTIVAGKPDEGMPDWRAVSNAPLSDQQITDVVAWLASLRKATTAKPDAHQPAAVVAATAQGVEK